MKEESDKDGISKFSHTLNLDRVIFIGRTFSEYMRMFNLEPSQLLGLKILDCPLGASSFVAEAYNEYNIKKVIGCDVLYDVVYHRLHIFSNAVLQWSISTSNILSCSSNCPSLKLSGLINVQQVVEPLWFGTTLTKTFHSNPPPINT